MVTQYFFARPDQAAETRISGFSFTVRTDKEKPQEAFEVMEKVAVGKAGELATADGVSATLIGQAGIPDLQIVLQGGTVKAIFYRNANMPPCVVVHDLDYADDQDSMIAELSHQVQQSGYAQCVYLESAPQGE